MLLLLGVLLVLAPALARAQTADSLVLNWTAPSDPGVGAVVRYDIRWSAAAITAANFASATVLTPPTPGAPGAAERFVIRGLAPGRSYWFAIRSADGAGNWSAISNVVRFDGFLDTAAPPTPSGFVAVANEQGGVALQWAPGTAPDLAGYHVWRSLEPSVSWSSIGTVSDTTFLDAQPPAGASKIWYAVSAFDRTRNESARSGSRVVVLTLSSGNRPTAWNLGAAYPNPARTGDVMHLPVDVPASGGAAHVEILDAANQLVRRFDLQTNSAGSTRVDWDGTNDHGLAVSPGVYRAWLVAGDLRQFVRVARVP